MTTSIEPTGAMTPSTHEATNPNGTIGQEGFLQLMIAQLRSQNPLNPATNDEYIGELATFTELEQMTNLANAGELSGGIALIGHKVTYNGASGSASGTVESVQSGTSGTTLTISGVSGVPESAITEIS
ncbi:MAG TPA: flagellar hook capping FlgD N-terminal domain-containing protein [Solirubrobacteraceae bacterium]|nr:flagellar hook capping FlgD N-terminal domain-containing protein [Solirubrobacteraceae bacterium]